MADLVAARVRALIDGALDRVFAEPFDVRSARELEDLVAVGPVGNAVPAATTVTAFVAAATPMARRALAVANEQEMKAKTQEMRAALVQAESQIPLAISEAFRSGHLGVMDYYQMKNVIADTEMRSGIAGLQKSDGGES